MEEEFDWCEPVPVRSRGHDQTGRRRSRGRSVSSGCSTRDESPVGLRRCKGKGGNSSCPLQTRLLEESGRCTLLVEAPLKVFNGCPVPLLLAFDPEIRKEALGTVPAGAVRTGATVKAYDGLGGSVSWAVGFGPEARGGSGGALGDAELGARGAELCPVRPDGQGFLWWELEGRTRHVAVPPDTNAVELRRSAQGLEWRCFRAAALPKPSEVLELAPHEPLSIFDLPPQPTRLSVALESEQGRSEWTLPVLLPALAGEPFFSRSSSSAFEVLREHPATEEVLEVRWGRALLPLVARRNTAPCELVLGARRWFVNNTSLPVHPVLSDGTPLPRPETETGATLLGHLLPPALEAPVAGGCAQATQGCCQRLRGCFQSAPDPNLTSAIHLTHGLESASAQMPGVGGFEDINFAGQDCILREESLALSVTRGVDCSVVSLCPALLLYNSSAEDVAFLWHGQDLAEAVRVRPKTAATARAPPAPPGSMRTSFLVREQAERRLQVVLRREGRVSVSPAFSVGRDQAGWAVACALDGALCAISLDEDRGAMAVSVAGEERCHKLQCHHPALEAFLEHEPKCRAQFNEAVHFGLQELGQKVPVLVLQRLGSPKKAQLSLNLTRNGSQTLSAQSSLGVPARVEVAVKERVAVVTVSLCRRQEVNPEVLGSLESTVELQLGGLTLALAEPLICEAQPERTAETLSVALDGVKVRLRRFNNDSEEFCLRINSTQVDLRPKKAQDLQPKVLLASVRSWRSLEVTPFLRWSCVRLSRSEALRHFQCCRLELGTSEVTITEAVWQELGRFQAPSLRGLHLEELRARQQVLPAPPAPQHRLLLERFSVEAVNLKVWCSLYLPEATFLPQMLRSALELMGLGTETLLIEGAKVRVAPQPWLVGAGPALVGSASSVLDGLSRAYLPQVRRNVFSLVANSNAAFGGLLGFQWWGRLCGCARRQTVRALRPALCTVGPDGAIRADMDACVSTSMSDVSDHRRTCGRCRLISGTLRCLCPRRR
ncbi:unnamed protein product [Effrenium voratum]|nr:unnamed protein product [Effrenium voratum]